MKSKEITRLMDKYLSRNALGDLEEAGVIIDSDFLKEALANYVAILLEVTDSENLDFGDLNVIRHSFMEIFPSICPAIDTDVIEIYYGILDFYAYIYEKKILNQKEYQAVMEYIIKQRNNFLLRMTDSSYWTPEKRALLFSPDDLPADLGNDYLNLFDTLDLGQPRKVPQNNVISVDFGKREVTSKESSVSWAYQVRIDIKGEKPPVWRRVLLPEKLTFEKLHYIIQTVFFGLEFKEDLYRFFVEEDCFAGPPEVSQFFLEFQAADAQWLDNYLNEGKTIHYEYGLDDVTYYTLKLENIIPTTDLETISLPNLVKGRGDFISADGKKKVYDEKQITAELLDLTQLFQTDKSE